MTKSLEQLRDSNPDIYKKVSHFLENEKQFHLGFLPTEQPHPITKNLEKTTLKNTSAGVKLMLKVDKIMLSSIEKVLSGGEFQKLSDSMLDSAKTGGRIIFSGCGATGRLSILLESAWRKFWQKTKDGNNIPDGCENIVESIMTGGDYALVKSVESFEDYQEFGRRQTLERKVSREDTFVAVSEGGETSSVIGSALQAIENGANVFFVFNNPAELLASRIKRSADLIGHPKCTFLDISSGPMAIAGSTRLQAVTSELIILGSALEKTAMTLLGEDEIGAYPGECATIRTFEKLISDLEKEKNLSKIQEIVEFEEKIYSQNGLVTYFANNVLLDIFTDTTERAPTFMLPPFVKCDDNLSPQSWAFIKNPSLPTEAAWEQVFGRMPRCLSWTKTDYKSMGAADSIINNPPPIGDGEIVKFRIGNESFSERIKSESPSAAIAILSVSDSADMDRFTEKFDSEKKSFSESRTISFGFCEAKADWNIPCEIRKSPIMLWEHLAVKLVMNIVSTLTMVRMGRVKGNWMSYVEASNKKLLDRSIRLISELCGIQYEDACAELFLSLDEIAKQDWKKKSKPSPVQYTLNRIGKS